MTTLFYRDPRLFALAVLMIMAAGASAILNVGRQEDPTITNLFATVVTPFPGADPARVEAQVTAKIEEELREIPEIDSLQSTSRAGISVITIELSQFISDQKIEQTWSVIRDALADAAVNLPTGVPEPSFDNDRTGAFTAISVLTMREGRPPQGGVMRRYGEALQDRLRNVKGTKLVSLYGARDEEIRVVVDPVRLSELGLTAQAVSSAIARADAKVRAGQLRGNRASFIIELDGEIRSLDRVRQVPLVDAPDGRIVRVGDVADVRRTVVKPASSLALHNGRPAVLIAARMENDIQVDGWMARIKRELKAFEAELPFTLKHEQTFDQSLYTYDRLAGVIENLAIGVGLVVLVLLVTLGWRAAVIVALILPLASLISIFGLGVAGISIHQMSVTGLIVALGLLVDAGIVMTDDIRRRLAQGTARLTAVHEGVKRLAAPLLASTVTTALAFMPMALLPGPAGDFVGAIAIAVIIMLGASLVLALTLTPAMSAWIIKRPKAPTGARNGRSHEGGPGGEEDKRGLFGASIDLALAHPRLAILASLILPVIGFGSFTTLKAQFFPGVDRDQFYVQIKLPEGTAIERTRAVARKASAIIRDFEGIRQLTWVIGESAPAFYYNMQANQDNQPSFAEALIRTASPKRTEELLPLLQRRLDADLPEARATVRGLVQGPPVAAPVEIRINGPNLAKLRDLGEEVRRIMLSVPDVLQARTQILPGPPKVVLDLDEERVRLAGLTIGEVAAQLDARFSGATGGSLLERTEELPVRVRVGNADRRTIDALAKINLVRARPSQAEGASGSGSRNARFPGVPVTALGDIKIVPSQTPIYRKDGRRINTVQGFVHRSVLPEEALKKVRAAMDEAGFKLPDGYNFEVGGDADARDETLRNLLASLGIILALTLATIVMTFSSYRLAGVTVTVAVLSMGLSILALAVCRYPFGIMAVIGVIGAIGVSINAAIIIMSALQDDARALAGDVKRIRELVVAQSRHIISTTLTTFGGFLPLILEGGGFWPPFAMAIAGGVLLSTVISFYFTPPAFALLARHGRLLSTRPDLAAKLEPAADAGDRGRAPQGQAQLA
ncbi:MAG: efflux RND transporter permease subunit [Pseudomonadota bacterium]